MPGSETPTMEELQQKLNKLQQEKAAIDKQVEQSEGKAEIKLPEERPWWTPMNAMTVCSMLLVFLILVLGMATYLIRMGKSAESILRIFGTILIIVITVFLVVAGYDDQQIAPVVGLLGTVAGYLLGKEPFKGGKNQDVDQEEDVKPEAGVKETL